jgi:hypothetical protein
MGRLLKAGGAAALLAGYLWAAAVHHAPRVRARKAARRAVR